VAAALLTLGLGAQLDPYKSKPILCICNGFQIGVKAGFFGKGITLAVNETGTFVHRAAQPHIVPHNHDTFWLNGLEGQILIFPCAHAEGNLTFTSRTGWRPALFYPCGENPDGSAENIAGVTSLSGEVFGLMNHPERAQQRQENLTIFENGVRAVRG
jgi:phosphoribosylformylglycinamidine synthase